MKDNTKCLDLIDNIEYNCCFTDLHIHLDGSISVDNARKLADLQKIDIPDSDDAIRNLLIAGEDCRNLNDFLSKFDFPLSLLQTYEGLEMATYNLVTELSSQGLMYAEIRFAPQLHTGKGMTMEEAVRAVIEGANRGMLNSRKKNVIDDVSGKAVNNTDNSIIVNIILCCMRDSDTFATNMKTIELAKKYTGEGVVAVDLAGAEAIFSNDNYIGIFKKAVDLGLSITIHAGEADGADSVASALDMGATRIGHGVRSLEDDSVVERIVKERIPLELCPTSNIITCIFKDIKEYPIKKLMDVGAIITVNTDDCAVCGTSIKKEWIKLVENHDISENDIVSILINSIDASYATEEQKKQFKSKITRLRCAL